MAQAVCAWRNPVLCQLPCLLADPTGLHGPVQHSINALRRPPARCLLPPLLSWKLELKAVSDYSGSKFLFAIPLLPCHTSTLFPLVRSSRVDFRGRAVAVAASNNHSACLTSGGEVWTWGANHEGQLGYGTNNSNNNPTPRLVEAMKVRACACACACACMRAGGAA